MMVETAQQEGRVLRLCDGWRDEFEQRVRVLAEEHAALRNLCDRLERIADDLPRQPAAEERQAVIRDLQSLMGRHQQREDAFLSSLLRGQGSTPLERGLLARIRWHHAQDEMHARDLSCALQAARPEGFPIGAEAMGYMLRCFFDGCRRAMAFEELAILVLARQRLSGRAAGILIQSLGSLQEP
ncbi:hemerythrin domain-containing protein [Roseomonas marmotae]|uniref:Hemerythrin domain-containing protein n=1 Tax=Roseomonas marmotae TaxID=2768161 RepID=A0ABS3K8R8_9PROT|nr:hemerythrin domain-containing protein [Roseomonas marmotae]MBO1073861.1 hemerythrin domain-containing protein [Roseomonas marmotae]QTI78513.1 hemerythrin domain-containing protein [Roseomonas marmotae]